MSLPRQNSNDARVRKRRKRTIITAEQLEKLEKTFKQEQWPNKLRKERLAFELGSNEQFVSIWFQNKRARVKREEEIAKMQLTDKCFMISETQKSVDDFNTDHDKTSAMATMSMSPANDLASMSDDSVSESVTTSEQFEKNGNEEMAPEVVVPQSPATDIKPTVSQEDNTSVGVTTSEQELLTSTSSTSSIFHASSPAAAVTNTAAAAPSCKPVTSYGGKLSLFRAIINMIAVTEGGIVDRTDPEFPTAVNDALYGIYVNQNSRLVYDHFCGLDLVDFD